MRVFVHGVVVVLLCFAARAVAGEPPADARLQEAQRAYDEAKTLDAAGRYTEAVARGEQALVLRQAVLGDTHPEVSHCLDLLGRVHHAQGHFAQAESLLQRGLAMREEALGKSHPDVASSLNNLARLYWQQGLYAQAEPLLQRALAMREEALGKNHPDVASSLNNLAALYWKQGLYAQAEPLCARALAIREAAFGKSHPDVAQSLNGLAHMARLQGSYERAEPLYVRALAIREEALGKNHPDVAQSLNNLAALYREQGLYGRAEPLLKRSLAIWEAAVGKNHPEVAIVLTHLAHSARDQGQYRRAEPLYARALAIREAALGKNHPEVALSLHNLALLKQLQRRPDAAVPLFMRAFTLSEQRLRQEALGFSEARLASLLLLLRTEEEPLYALLREHPGNARVRRLALSAALLLKGRSVEEMADISRTVYRSLGAEEHATLERLRELRTQLARVSLQGLGSLSPEAYQHQLHGLAEQGDALEADLARRSAPLRALTALPAPEDIVDRVAQALPGDGALVELISYVDRPVVPGSLSRPPRPRYLALVLFPDATTRALDLGAAEPIDVTASDLRAALGNRDAGFQAHARQLHRLVFQPLRPLLGQTRRLFLSPDGQLALVPFSALHDGRQFLVEAFDFTYLTSGKDLLPRAQEPVPATSVAVLAHPDFGAPALERTERSASVERFFSALRESPAQRAWDLVPLPGTREEAESIQRLLPQAQLFLGAEATKQRLMHLPTPGILHLATHGFFLEDAPAPMGSRALGQSGALGEDSAASRARNPLLRSGLLFAGATVSDSALVTALELAGLDLWGTQLVVLSACDTGRGAVQRGQGVYGLRRAFIVAGAETVVTSLWKVDDGVTSALMEAYYRNLLAGQGRAAAMREAMRTLRQTRPHPHFWAPFIVLGRDTPLHGLTPAPEGPPGL